MNERQARNLHAAATGWQELLAIQFPCEACEGSGSSEQGVCAIPCVECWGRGYRLPEEGQ